MLKSIMIVSVGANLLFSCTNNTIEKSTIADTIDTVVTPEVIVDTIAGWTEINFEETGIIEQLAYADTANFMGKQIYPCAKCFLRPEAAQALLKADSLAKELNLKLILFDCYRPKMYQKIMYDIVQNPKYVASPEKSSMHNKGLAVDIGLTAINGKLLDFGTAFDDFSENSHYNATQISEEAKNNRKTLRTIMTDAGFSPYNNEWWHFNFKQVKYPADDFVWNCN